MQTLEDGQVGQALGKLKELIRQFPESPHVRVRYMQACHSVGNRALVRQTLEDIVEAGMLPGLQAQQDWTYPPDRYVYEYADLLRLSSDTSQKAESLLLRLIGRQPGCAGAWHNLADLLWDKRDEPGALLGYGISAGLAENDEHAARAYADALAALGREEEASRWLESRARRFRNPLHVVSPWITWIAFLEDRGYPERALSACDEALAQQGAPAELLAFAVPFFARMGDWTRAEADLGRLRDAGLPYAFFEAATRLHRMRGDLESAARSAAAWVAELPRSIDARQSLLDVVAAREGPEAAVRASRRWMLENRDHEGFEEAYCAQLDRAAAPPGRKYRVLLRRLKRNPEDAWAWLQSTFVHLNNYEIADDGRRERLAPRIVRFLAECDRTSAGAVMTARAHAFWSELRGDWAGAVSRSLESIALAPESFYSYRRAWDCSSRLGAEEREALWGRLEPVFLGFPGRLTIAREVVGLLAERFGVAAAETSVATWRTARPDDPDILEAAADLLIEHGHGRSDAARAIDLLEPAVRRYPFHSGLRFSLANAYRRAGRDAEAEAVLAEIARRHPDNSAAGIRLAMIMSRRGDDRGALASLDRMMTAEPWDADPLAARAEILIDGARFEEAVRDIEGGLDRLPSDPLARPGDLLVDPVRGRRQSDPSRAGRRCGRSRQRVLLGRARPDPPRDAPIRRSRRDRKLLPEKPRAQRLPVRVRRQPGQAPVRTASVRRGLGAPARHRGAASGPVSRPRPARLDPAPERSDQRGRRRSGERPRGRTLVRLGLEPADGLARRGCRLGPDAAAASEHPSADVHEHGFPPAPPVAARPGPCRSHAARRGVGPVAQRLPRGRLAPRVPVRRPRRGREMSGCRGRHRGHREGRTQ